MSAPRILDLTRTGRISPETGALLLELRRRIAWRRRPWWERAVITLLEWPTEES